MVMPFMFVVYGMDTSIDEVDYAILKCLKQCDACWKKRVYDWTREHIDEVPLMGEKSLQTIGRRIDRLHDEGLVDNCIMSPDAADRDMIIGYHLTDAGREALQAKRQRMLQDKAKRFTNCLITGDGDPQVDRDALVALMRDEFDIGPEGQAIIEQLETRELLTVLTGHYINTNADDHLARADLVADLLERAQRLADPLMQDNTIAHIHDRLDGTAETSMAEEERNT